MTYDNAAALRTAIEDRIRNTSGDVLRARRRIVFERFLARLIAAEPDAWVLKGGFALEVRMPDRARATRDVDLAVAPELAQVDVLRDAIVEALAVDEAGDRFVFALRDLRSLPAVDAGRTGWKLSIRADLDGRIFETISGDVVARTTELERTEQHRLASALAFAGVPDLEIEVVDLDHHFAEKLAAYTTDYGDRENSRVKDLADLVLLVEHGIQPTRDLHGVVDAVFAQRNRSTPLDVPAPPASWTPTYVAIAEEIDLEARTLAAAHRAVSEFWIATTKEIV